MENQEPIFEGFSRISKSFDDYYNDPTHPYAMVKVFIDGEELKTTFTVEFTQRTNDHDTFKIITPDDSFDSFEGYILEKSRHLFGKNVMIQFARFGKVTQTFEGIITNINNPKHDGGGYGDLHIIGAGTSILLESGKDCRSFEDKSLDQIIKEVCENYPREARVEATFNQLNLDNRFPIHYTVQYKESDYEFIKRLAKLHGEFFYYTGDKLIFGNTAQDYIKIQENSDLAEETFYASLLSQDFKYLAYNPETGEVIEQESQKVKTEFKANHFGAMAVIASRKIFPKKPVMQFNNAKNERELEKAVRLEREKRENLFFVKGKSRAPELKIGGRAELSDINGKAMETYRIIEIRHYHDGYDYYNEFIGIPDLFNASPFIDTEAFPVGEIQSARVMDNNDPKGMGRVRVQFPWQIATNQMTPWIHVVTPHAGANRGIYFPPEIGEEVLINYENNNAEKPFVMGAMYNGAEKSGYHTSGNDLKAIKTRSGIEQLYNDAEGSWKQSTPDGNFLHFDGQGNATLNVPKDLRINVGENFNINVGQNISFLVGLKAIYNIGIQMMMNTPILKYFVSDNYHLQSPKTLINGEGEIKIEAKETNVAGTQKLLIHSEESTIVNSKGLVEVKGQEGTHNDNKPLDFELSTTEEIAKAIVYFRTVEGKYDGEFGFDWNRKADNGLTKESAYQTLIKGAYRRGATQAVTETEAYGLFKDQYYQLPIRRNNVLTNETYETPVLQIFSQAFVQTLNLPKDAIEPSFKAELRVLIEIEEDLDRLEFDFNKAYFNLDKTVLKKKEKTKELIDSKEKITITCLQDLTTDLYISIYAYPKNSKDPAEKTLAGKIKVLKNDASARRHLDIVWAKVHTKIVKATLKGDCNDNEMKFLQKALHQCLTTCTISQGPLLDLTADDNFKVTTNTAKQEIYGRFIYKKEEPTNTKVVDKKINEDASGIFKYMKDEYIRQNSAYSNSMLVFAFGESTYDTYKEEKTKTNDDGDEVTNKKISTISGIANNENNVALLFLGENGGKRKEHTMAHEVLHALGLMHLHMEGDTPDYFIKNPNRAFAFKYKTTDNIMAYDVEGKTVMQWQWDIAKRDIPATNLPPVKPPKTDKK